MAISTAERNRRKRERKKKEKEQRRAVEKKEAASSNAAAENKENDVDDDDDVVVEYVPEAVATFGDGVGAGGGNGNDDDDDDMAAIMRRFEERSSVAVISDDDEKSRRRPEAESGEIDDGKDDGEEEEEDDDDDDENVLSKRKLRELTRPTVARLKNEVVRSDLVEAHDVTAADPHFLVYLKSVPNTVPVPRHWGRKRKYLQGKRGIEKAPFALPAFIVKTGITEIRSASQADEAAMSLRQKNRARVAPRSYAADVDYRTLHDAFFKYQTKPRMTAFGDLYHEGREFETADRARDLTPGVLSERLRTALGMVPANSPSIPPPWLLNMQRHGPPPSYPNLRIPGLNAPLPRGGSYGYHADGWGKPPVDAFGRPLYGGDPFGQATTTTTADEAVADNATAIRGVAGAYQHHNPASLLVTSDGKTLLKDSLWGALPAVGDADDDEDDEDEDESSEEEDDDDDDDDEGEETAEDDANPAAAAVDAGATDSDAPLPSASEDDSGARSVLPAAERTNLRKTLGDETPLPASANKNVDEPPPPLYRVLETTEADAEAQKGAVFRSEVAYVLPGGAESVLAKEMGDGESTRANANATTTTGGRRRKRGGFDDAREDDDDGALGKKFKF